MSNSSKTWPSIATATRCWCKSNSRDRLATKVIAPVFSAWSARVIQTLSPRHNWPRRSKSTKRNDAGANVGLQPLWLPALFLPLVVVVFFPRHGFAQHLGRHAGAGFGRQSTRQEARLETRRPGQFRHLLFVRVLAFVSRRRGDLEPAGRGAQFSIRLAHAHHGRGRLSQVVCGPPLPHSLAILFHLPPGRNYDDGPDWRRFAPCQPQRFHRLLHWFGHAPLRRHCAPLHHARAGADAPALCRRSRRRLPRRPDCLRLNSCPVNKPTQSEFVSLASQGNLIPVTRKILADFETPRSAYRKIRGEGESFLFESVEGGERVGRYSFVGCNPRAVIRQTENRVEVLENGKVAESFAVGKDVKDG